MTTKIVVQKLNDKFINNIELSTTPFCNKKVLNITGYLYRIYYIEKFTHIIFAASLLDNEINQFIDEFGTTVNIFIYNDTTKYIEHHPNLKGVIQKTKTDSKNKIITIPKLVNNEIYYSDNSIPKQDSIVCFLDNIESLPEALNNYLYPQSILSIKLFNNSSIIHPQNLGLLFEYDKARILKQNKYYLALTDDYVPEAWACGALALDIDDLNSLTPSKYKHTKSFQSYSNFLKVLISDKK
jgi:hypothetical protein